MLTYRCPTCDKEYDADVTEKGTVYISHNKRIVLKDKNSDCNDCEAEIRKAQEAKRAEIRATRQL